jgi:hypothetical protein
MAQFEHQLDPENTSSGFEVIPDGRYEAMITDSDIVPTKAGTGEILKLTFDVISGKFKGSKVFKNINIKNQSAQATAIGETEINALQAALYINFFRDTVELHNKPVGIVVSSEQKDGYDRRNVIKKFYGLADEDKQDDGQKPAATPATGKARPWEDKGKAGLKK